MELTIRPVTASLRLRAEALEVYPSQSGFIESVKECMEEADELSAWNPVGIFNGPDLIGFSMYGLIEESAYTRVWFDRLLIDRRWQGQGFGREAVRTIISRMQKEFPGWDIYLSVYEDNPAAIGLYQSFGFHFTGELDTKGEKVMCLPASLA